MKAAYPNLSKKDPRRIGMVRGPCGDARPDGLVIACACSGDCLRAMWPEEHDRARRDNDAATKDKT